MKLIDILNTTEELNTFDHIGTDKNTVHSFAEAFYEREFKKYQNKEVSLLEIGINAGGSLYLWGKFFEKGTVLGIDIQDKVREKWKSLPNVTYKINNAYQKSFIDTLGNFDIIIDDGPHTLESQILCIDLYLEKLNDGGVMIIEDVQDVNHLEILKNATPEKFRNNVEMVDLRFVKGRYDDLLFVIRK